MHGGGFEPPKALSHGALNAAPLTARAPVHLKINKTIKNYFKLPELTPPGFEPGSTAPQAVMLSNYTTGSQAA